MRSIIPGTIRRLPLLVVALGVGCAGSTGPLGVTGDHVRVGRALAADEGMIVAGGQASAFGFARGDAGWGRGKPILVTDDPTYSLYGTQVAVSGDTALVGRFDDIGVFRYDGHEWVEKAPIRSPEPAVSGGLGMVSAIHGDTAITPEWLTIDETSRMRVFERDRDDWTFVQDLVPDDPAWLEDDLDRMAMSEDTIVLTHGADRACVFVRDGETWRQDQIIVRPGAFGSAVAVSGDTLIASNEEEQTAVLFTRTDGVFTERHVFEPNPVDIGWYFGTSVALSEDFALIGSPSEQIDGVVRGAAYVIAREGDSWVQDRLLTLPGDDAYTDFGTAVAIAGDTFVVGAPQHRISSRAEFAEGSVTVFPAVP